MSSPVPPPDLRDILTRLAAIADTAPIGALGLDKRTLSRATTLGYNQIGHIHNASATQLLADFGADGMHDILRALRANGLSDGPGQEAASADLKPEPEPVSVRHTGLPRTAAGGLAEARPAAVAR